MKPKENKMDNGIDNSKKKNYGSAVTTLILFIFFIIGAGVAAYPYLSNMLARFNCIQTIQDYNNYTVSLSAEELAEEWEQAIIYNENLAGDPVRDPFIPYSGMALPENYELVLNVQNDGIMGYLEVPSVNIQLMIAHGTSEEVLETHIGHIEQTALPIGGENTHAVLTAHTGLPSARLFTDLVDVEEGDRFYIYILDKVLSYEVDKIDVILPEEIERLEMIKGKDYVTLLTCTPYGVNSHRLLVRGRRIPNENPEETMTRGNEKIRIVLSILGATVLVVIICWRIKAQRKKRKIWVNNSGR